MACWNITRLVTLSFIFSLFLSKIPLFGHPGRVPVSVELGRTGSMAWFPLRIDPRNDKGMKIQLNVFKRDYICRYIFVRILLVFEYFIFRLNQTVENHTRFTLSIKLWILIKTKIMLIHSNRWKVGPIQREQFWRYRCVHKINHSACDRDFLREFRNQTFKTLLADS